MAYDPVQIPASRLKGVGLSIAAYILEHRTLGTIPARSMLRGIGMDRLREREYAEAPRYYPLITSSAPEAHTSPLPGAEIAKELGVETAKKPTPGFTFPSVIDYSRIYHSGSLTPADLAERIVATLQQHNRGNPPLNAFIAWDAQSIRRQAAESTRRIAEGKARSLFEGVPVAIKDELDLEGYATSLGTGFLNGEVARSDAFVVRRLKEAGAIILGKTNMHEIGIGVTGLNPFHGTAVNPYAPWRYPGGSSSGSGSVVASGICPVAIGADGGGSVRIPAAYCGVFGLKMTWGRVSTAGEFPLARSVGNNGPIAATARDLALAYLVTAGHDPDDPTTGAGPAPHLEGFLDSLDGVRIGIYTPWFESAHREVTATARTLLNRLVNAGATLVEIEIPELEELRLAHLMTITLEMNAALETQYRDHRHEFGPETRANLALCRYLTTTDYIKAQQARARMIDHVERIYATVDLIATPTTGNLPPRFRRDRASMGISDVRSTTETMRFTVLANMTGNPAVSVPAGFVTETSRAYREETSERDGDRAVFSRVPVGLQCIGRHWEEPLLLRVARIAEEQVVRPRPRVYLSPLTDQEQEQEST